MAQVFIYGGLQPQCGTHTCFNPPAGHKNCAGQDKSGLKPCPVVARGMPWSWTDQFINHYAFQSEARPHTWAHSHTVLTPCTFH